MSLRKHLYAGIACLVGTLTTGCGTTRTSDTARTGTEQLLISHSVDQAISEMDFSSLAGKKVFFDPQYLADVVDKGYVISSIRQHLLAHGCYLQEERKDAAYVVEARAGAVGTDRNEVLYGIPQMQLPTVIPGQPGGPFPEMPLAKRTNRAGVAKIAVFAFNRETGQPVWQSGVVLRNSTSKDSWIMGSGPYTDGTLVTGTKTNGQVIQVPVDATPSGDSNIKLVSVTQGAVWQEDPKLLQAVAAKKHAELVKTARPPGLTDPNVVPAVDKRKE